MRDANANSRFSILSIAGGNTLGAVTAGAIAEMERSAGQRIVAHFDLTAGSWSALRMPQRRPSI